MATSAFKSTTKRPSIGKSTTAEDSSSSSYSSSNRSNATSAHRRSRSLSRFSRPILSDDFSDEPPAPRGRFVNTKRGSAFPADVTLDDLAVKFFNSGDRGRSVTKNDDDGRVGDNNNKGNASQRRGRSVSRRVGGEGAGNSYGGGGRRLSSDNSSRRQRSVSVVRYQISDSESDLDHHRNSSSCVTSRNFGGGVTQVPLSSKTAASNHPKGLRRSLSQKDLKYHDGYSSHSSVLTDDEGRDAHSNVNGIERTIRAVYSQKKGEHPSSENINSGMYEAMRKELRNAVEEIKMELEQASRKSNGDDCFQEKSSDALQTVSTIRRNYANKLEVSEKRKQDLLAEILLEEQRGRELSKMVKELLPEPKNNIVEKPFRTRKKSNDRNRMSKRLTEEAEKYFEDFISNVEDTDISSLDGEMTDTSSSLGGITKTQIFRSPAMSKPATVEMDGVVLPWLQWETSNDTPFVSKKTELMGTPKIHLRESTQEASPVRDLSNHSVSSHGSWSPGLSDGHSATVSGNRFVGEYGNSGSQTSSGGTKFDIDDYLERQSEEDFIFERRNQQQRIHSGSVVICSQMFF